jgi:hypothetical protein
MDHALTRAPGAASEPAPRLSDGGLFIEALARRDFAALAGCLDPSARLRALLPRGPVEVAWCEEMAGWFRALFGGPGGLELVDLTVGQVGPRLYLRWRADLTPAGSSGPRRFVEQHAFADCRERISGLDLLRSGFVAQPGTAVAEQGRVPCPERQ